MSAWEDAATRWAEDAGCAEAVEWAKQNGLPPLESPEAERDRAESVAAAQLELHRRRAAPYKLTVSEEVVQAVIGAARRASVQTRERLRPTDHELVPGARVLDALGLGEWA